MGEFSKSESENRWRSYATFQHFVMKQIDLNGFVIKYFSISVIAGLCNFVLKSRLIIAVVEKEVTCACR